METQAKTAEARWPKWGNAVERLKHTAAKSQRSGLAQGALKTAGWIWHNVYQRPQALGLAKKN